MKKVYFKLLKVLIFLFCWVSISCVVGLGDAPDLEAPEITIISPKNLSLTKRNIVVTGTCKDNYKVTEVIVTDKQTGFLYGNADISGDNWSINLELEEGDRSLLFTAKDAANNSSVKSVKSLDLLVDETAPEGFAWYIDRGDGVQVPLMGEDELKNLNTSLATNKHIPQNEKFTVNGRFYDAMGIDEVRLIISCKDENGENKVLIEKSFVPDDSTGKTSKYTPEWTFTHSDLVKANNKLESGKHYLQLSYYSVDEHKNSAKKQLDYILWYPERDIPGIQINGIETNSNGEETLNVSLGDSIAMHFFDDDSLDEIRYKFVTKDEYNEGGYTKKNLFEKIEKNPETNISGRTDYPCQIKTEDTGEYYLLACAKDKNVRVDGHTPQFSSRIIKTTVSDASMPLLVIESPAENSIPEFTGNKFKIQGYSYDTSGSKQIKIAYIPTDDSEERAKRAKELFDGTTPDTAGGEILRTKKFSDTKTKGDKDKWFKEEFEIEFDIIDDFSEEKRTSLKIFEIMLEDIDGNKVYKQFNVAADTVSPEIKIQSPQDMIVCDYRNNDLTLSFKAEKSTGLGIDPNGYYIERKDNSTDIWSISNGKLKLNNGYYEVTIPRADLKKWADGTNEIKANTQQTFIFHGKDVLGNEGSDQRTVILSPLPVLENITVDKISGTYPAGTTLNFQAKFSDSVKVTGTPRLKLTGLTGTEPYYAKYKNGTGTDTLTFSFISPKDVSTNESESLSCDSTLGKIDLNGGTIETGTQGSGNATIEYNSLINNFWNSSDASIKKEIKLDGVSPYITKISPKCDGVSNNSDGKLYVNKNKEIILEVEFSEKVLVTGNPVIKINEIEFKFQSIDGTIVNFSHTVLDGENCTLNKIDSSSISTSDINSIKDEAGNSMSHKDVDFETTVRIDTTLPAAPDVVGISLEKNQQIFNKSPEITLSLTSENELERIEYSLNGGMSWTTYTTPISCSESGDYVFTSRAIDKASNVSQNSKPINIIINDTFPEIEEISIACVDGDYIKGKTVEFKVFLSENVELYNKGEAKITFTDTNGNNERTIEVQAAVNSINKLIFPYTITESDDINGIKITALTLGNIQDKYSNKSSEKTTKKIEELLETDNCNRKKVHFDGKPPVIEKYKLGDSGKYSLNDQQNVSSSNNDNFSVTLIFNENVIKESGEIVLQQKGNWAIPPVLTSSRFSELYNKMTVKNREKMCITEKGDGNIVKEKLNEYTGLSYGPYRKITHGLIEKDGKAVPDLSTKFVLDYQYGLYDNNDVVNGIRDALKSVGYDKHTVDVNSNNVTVSGNTVTIKFTEQIEDGREWELLIPDTAFFDETGNKFAGLKEDALSLWSNNVATPVVRVDRYSHGMGAKGLDENGNEVLMDKFVECGTNPAKNDTNKNSGRFCKPLGYANVRIDCETPGANIHYKTINKGTAVYTAHQFTNDSNNDDSSHKSELSDIDMTSLSSNESYTLYSTSIKVGDVTDDINRFKTSRKDYVTAYATKTGFTKSSHGYEGVFKTVIIMYNNNGDNKPANLQINIEGGTATGGEPNVSGFPLKDATTDNRYSKNAYLYQEGEKDFFAWISYEIVSTNFAVLQHRTNYSSSYPSLSYGQLLYLYKFSTWE